MSKPNFDCKLAHKHEIKKISNFNSIKELYERINQTFKVPIDQILFCTIGSSNPREMKTLLGNYLSFGDLIVVHLCGETKEINIVKTQEYLGLTITDNGNGRAFVKKVKANDNHIAHSIKPGDHISAINSKSTFGMRHYEVARAIREVPERTTFTLGCTEPLYLVEKDILLTDHTKDLHSPLVLEGFSSHSDMDCLSDRALERDFSPVYNFSNTISLELDSIEDLANSSLPIDRLLSKGLNSDTDFIDNNSNLKSNSHEAYRIRIEKINTILESFLGINDNHLAVQIYRLAKEHKESYKSFIKAINGSELSVFNFDEGIELNLWNVANEHFATDSELTRHAT